MTESESKETSSVSRSLVWHGALMTSLGLLSGFTTLVAKAPSAALAAHTIGVVQGALLFGMAGAWPMLRASDRTLAFVRYSLLTGLYANWIGSQLAGFWSARAMFVVTGAAMPEGATQWMEVVVGVLLNLSALVLVACLVLLWTSRKPAEA